MKILEFILLAMKGPIFLNYEQIQCLSLKISKIFTLTICYWKNNFLDWPHKYKNDFVLIVADVVNQIILYSYFFSINFQ